MQASEALQTMLVLQIVYNGIHLNPEQ